MQVIKPPTIIEIQGPMFTSYAVAGHIQFKLTQISGGVELFLRHRALGLIEDEHREGVVPGWDHVLKSVKRLAEKLRARISEHGQMTKNLDHIWKALSDLTRREILDLLRDGPRQTTEIVDKFQRLSRFGVMKHLDVLRQAGLINTRSEGRRRVNSLNVAPIRQILERWINKYEAYWTNTLLRVKESAEVDQAEKKRPKKKRA